jgi:CheY-like chemotaxis protein
MLKGQASEQGKSWRAGSRILLLEDDPSDAELIREILEVDHFVCEVTRVQRAPSSLPLLKTLILT